MKKAWQVEFATGTSVREVASAAPAAQHGQSAATPELLAEDVVRLVIARDG